LKFTQIVLVIFLSLVVSVAGTYYLNAHKSNGFSATSQETALERVKRTGILRCGYYVFAPMTIRDPNTSQLSGFSVDMMENIAKAASVKVEWVEQVDFGNWPAGLQSGRFDAVCTPVWPDAAVAREAIFTHSMFFASINAYARGDDHRFDNNLAAIDSPDVTIAGIEGNVTTSLAHDLFPKAKILAVPQNAPGGLPAENVITKKADIFFWDANGAQELLKSNPGSVHNVDPAHPVKIMPFVLAVKPGEGDMRDFLDIGVQSLENTGIINKLLDQWERYPGSFYRLAKPYITQPN